MTESSYILSAAELPVWVEYPHAFRRVVKQGLCHLTPWHLLEGHEAIRRHQGLAQRYPSRELFPFAYRQDNDDLACWERGTGERVIIVHDFASPGFEDEGVFDDTWAWFRTAVEETIAWD